MIERDGRRTIEIAESSGFCFGVRRAIELAERTLAQGGAVYSLGPVIHNPQETARLEGLGLKVIESIDEAQAGGVLVIRSHGISPETADAARAKGLTLVDATCPLVKRAQKLAQKLHTEDYRVAIIGDSNHPEVVAILGHAPGAAVVGGEGDLGPLMSAERLGVVSQTTESPERFRTLTARLAQGFCGHELRIFHTICSATMDRQAAAMELAGRVEVMFVLGGRNSANTRQLARLCSEMGVKTHHLETADELQADMLGEHVRVGVTAGASTPQWLVSEFLDRIKKLDQPS